MDWHSSNFARPATARLDRPHVRPDKAELLELRLRRLEGQVHGVQQMVADGRECEAILTQLAAISAAARSAGLSLLEAHIRDCVLRSGEPGPADAQELTGAIRRFASSLM